MIFLGFAEIQKFPCCLHFEILTFKCFYFQLIALHLEDKNPITNFGITPKQLMNAYIEDLKQNANDLFQ